MKGKANSRGRSGQAPRHVRLYHWLMNTAAWQDLNAVERCLYVEISERYAGPNSNNGRIPYSVREGAKALRISAATASRALRALQEHGFIVPMKLGAFSLKLRHATEWRLTEFPCDVTHAFATKDFTRWTPRMQMPVSVVKPTVLVVKPHGVPGATGVAP
jgi:hypothetical protein